MKALVLGCNGMAGHMISCYLQENGHDVTGYARKKSEYVKTIVGDATDWSLLGKTITNSYYDAVINCVGILNRAADENKSEAVLLNSYLPHFIADTVKSLPTKVIHISTDCVFSGLRGGYSEDELRDGTTFYDRSKALGELEGEEGLTIRTSIVGPDLNPKGIGLLNWFMHAKGPVHGYTGAIWTGITTLQLAKVVEEALSIDKTGLYNMVPEDTITKYDLLCLFNEYIRTEKIVIDPDASVSTDKSLRKTRFLLNHDIPDYRTMVTELSEWIRMHEGMYQHYFC